VLALDNIQGFLIQLACAGGSGAIAKTAVAPLERVKVSSVTCALGGVLLEVADGLITGPLHPHHNTWWFTAVTANVVGPTYAGCILAAVTATLRL